MNPFYQALEQGYSPEEVVKFISKSMPSMGSTIKKASRAGYTIQQILGFLSKNFNPEDRTGMSETERHAANRRSDAAMTKYGLKMAGGLIAAPIATHALRTAISRALPNSVQQLLHGKAGGAQQTNLPANVNDISSSAPTLKMPQELNQTQTSQQPPSSNIQPNITQPVNPLQPKGISNPIEYLDKLGIKDKVDQLLKAGNEPEAVAAALNIGNKGKKATGEIDPELVSVIKEYSQQNKPIEAEKIDLTGMGKGISDNLYSGIFEALQKGQDKFSGVKDPLLQAAKPAFEAGQIKSPEDLKKFAEHWEKSKKEQPKIAKNETVSTPNGIGTIKEIRNGQALVNVDGKLQKVKEDELEPLSFSENEVADAYDNLFAKIPEEHRSGFIQWSGYDEDRNVLGFIPRSGKYEELHNITPEEAQKIKEGTGIARTSGEKREGLWVQGEETRGGVISQIIHDRRKKQKAEEEKQLKLPFEMQKQEKEDKGMKPIFDELAYARNLSRHRERKQLLEERAKKKKEKDEAKKRKK